MNKAVNYYSDNLKKGGGVITTYILFFAMLSFPLLGFSADKVLYQKGSFIFAQKDANNLIELAEYIAGSRLSKKHRAALQFWAIDDYKNAPKIASSFYKTLANLIVPKIRKSKGNNTYRAELYLNFVDSYKKHPEYRKKPNNFLSVIDRYNPPIKEALLIRQIRFNSVMQQMQSNQRIFNQTIHQMQRSSDMINKSIRDQSARSSITIPGGKILRETDGKIYAEDNKGQKFEVIKE